LALEVIDQLQQSDDPTDRELALAVLKWQNDKANQAQPVQAGRAWRRTRKALAVVFFWAIGAVALILALGFALSKSYQSPDSRLWASEFGYPAMARKFDWPIPVETETVGMRTVEPTVSAEGVLEFGNLVPITIDVPGIIQNINVKIGATVAVGDPLLQLDLGGREVRMSQLDLELKREAYRAASASLDRISKLQKDGLVRYSELYDYEHDNREAKIAVSLAEETLRLALISRSEAVFKGIAVDEKNGEDRKMNILAPSNGSVVQIAVSSGETLVAPRQGAILIGSDIMFRAYVDQLHFSDVKVGQDATVYLLARPNAPISGKVERIEPFVAGAAEARATGQQPLTFVVWIKVTPTGGNLDDVTRGMNGYTILSQPSEKMVIAAKALLRYSGGQGVVLVVDENDNVSIRSVTYSWSDGARVAIESGLAVGDRVVVGGQIALREGDHVMPTEPSTR
jgi:membrane fusion protein, macrolide-specific efflux system